ncbi:cobalamin B12-binding domain-containing protein [Streptomyces kunmingensis]|uniref:Cobalamin B12-binding domain-containing protein n=1 Tax=Streptomyces kunmingensis TaxID=68225 RepID=A0ABU6CM74_9ACTN|nr:MerR family transcriptional regulator [Streptomyces kunmingensis]MEB3965834.1 cobalamin B12-binding domain-containing protein [Streptomyces kunmingensis]
MDEQHDGQDGQPDGPGPVAAAEPGVTTGALARRLGVSPTTLRTWDRRYGLGPAERAEGHHRRWSAQDVAVVEEMCRLAATGLPPAEAAHLARKRRETDRPVAVPRPRRAPGRPSEATLERQRRGLARAATRLDAPAVRDLLAEAVARYGLVGAWQDVMVPVLHAIGRKWEEAGDRYVEVEHLLSCHVSRALHRGPVASVTAAVPPLVLACVPAEEHSLPLEALSAALDELGLPQRMFGAAVPVEAVAAAVRRTGPRVVVLWAQARSTASLPLARHLAEARWGVRGARGGPTILLGGPGWAGHTVRGALRPTTLPEALTRIERIYPEVTAGPAPA